MAIIHKQGMNLLHELFIFAFEKHQCDELDCFSYNVNLDDALSLIKKYPHIKKLTFYANTQNFSFTPKNSAEIFRLIEDSKILIYHSDREELCIHAKLYLFKKNKELVFGINTSSNFSHYSNNNFESMTIFDDPVEISKMWAKIPELLKNYQIAFSNEPPYTGKIETNDLKIQEKLLTGLWEHQKAILTWLVQRNKAIVNIPPGCGKTRIATTYIHHLFNVNNKTTIVVLVPTKTLITQWIKVLNDEGIPAYEIDNQMEGLGQYFGKPFGKVVVTLYSRFFDNFETFIKKLRLIRPDLLTVLDECHNVYSSLDSFSKYIELCEDPNNKISKNYLLSLSATTDTFNKDLLERFNGLHGGQNNIFSLSLPRFYSFWNQKNAQPCLKKISYTPIYYNLTVKEMQKYKELSRYVNIEGRAGGLSKGKDSFGAAIKRAQFVRGLEGGIRTLKEYIQKNIDMFNQGNTIIFVQTHAFAEEIRDFIVKCHGWNPQSSAYIYDSQMPEIFLEYAIKQFKNNLGFCLISEIMLSEGFDIPAISRVILHGSHRSQRDWIQKIGRAIRYDPNQPDSIAEIIDVVFCDDRSTVLSIEEERHDILNSISIKL
jgi:superfamily II DNA or RNA helicase